MLLVRICLLELYSIMGEYDNAGFPLSYCLLSTASAIEIGKRTKALTAWANRLRDDYGIMPIFAHVDKDMAEIGMLRTSWKPKIQLPYDAKCAHNEFPFIRLDFTPFGSADITEYEGGNAYLYHNHFAHSPPQPHLQSRLVQSLNLSLRMQMGIGG